jgi:hypothetical protein
LDCFGRGGSSYNMVLALDGQGLGLAVRLLSIRSFVKRRVKSFRASSSNF